MKNLNLYLGSNVGLVPQVTDGIPHPLRWNLELRNKKQNELHFRAQVHLEVLHNMMYYVMYVNLTPSQKYITLKVQGITKVKAHKEAKGNHVAHELYQRLRIMESKVDKFIRSSYMAQYNLYMGNQFLKGCKKEKVYLLQRPGELDMQIITAEQLHEHNKYIKPAKMEITLSRKNAGGYTTDAVMLEYGSIEIITEEDEDLPF